MKKVLKKRMKNSSNAVRYFSTETQTRQMVTTDGECGIVVSVSSCPC